MGNTQMKGDCIASASLSKRWLHESYWKLALYWDYSKTICIFALEDKKASKASFINETSWPWCLDVGLFNALARARLSQVNPSM